MSDIRIANRYAKSILDLAVEQNQLPQIHQDMDFLRQAFQNRDLYNLIKSPIINKGKKLDIFSKIFNNNVSHLTLLFLSRVIKKGRESIIPEMVTAFTGQYNDKKGIVDVILITVSNMDQRSLETIKAQVQGIIGQGKNINLEVRQDDSLLGGFVLEYEDKRYDASVKHQLENIRKTFSA